MGVVYLARDERLDRAVAIKALPDELAADTDRLARFEREGRALAQLSHPNIAGIHGVEEHGGHKYLVLEYVEGETLAERLDRGLMPVDEALEVCEQIAAGKVMHFILVGMGTEGEEPLFRLAGDWDERGALATVGLMDLAKHRIFDLLQAIDADLIDMALDADENASAH